MCIFGQGYNGSQLWDVVFAVQAIVATDLIEEYGSVLKKAHNFVKNSQVKYFINFINEFEIWLINLDLVLINNGIKVRRNGVGDHKPSVWYRHISKGGWPFSTPDNAWAVSDCTSEALKVIESFFTYINFFELI